jgi:hypothetical protein
MSRAFGREPPGIVHAGGRATLLICFLHNMKPYVFDDTIF